MVKKSVDKDLYMLVDLSYVIFYKMFSTITWFTMSKTELTEDLLLAKFQKGLLDVLKSLVKLYCVEWKNVILAIDTPRKTIWRNNIFESYKKNRDNVHHQYAGLLFSETLKNLGGICKTLGCSYIAVHEAEADDICAVAHDYIHSCLGKRVCIITNDNDYIQLIPKSSGKTKIYNLKKKEIVDRVSVSIEHFLQVKIIVGDKSDNIPPITSRMGEKTALKLAQNPDKLETLLNSSLDIRNQYNVNKKLIDFEYIPQKFVDEVVTKLKTII